MTLKDAAYGLVLELHYYVYEKCDVIARSARLLNESDETVQIKRLMSTQLDFDMETLVCTTFHGAWAREMKRTDVCLHGGKYVNESYTGTSSSRTNPFVMLAETGTNEDSGACYGINLYIQRQPLRSDGSKRLRGNAICGRNQSPVFFRGSWNRERLLKHRRQSWYILRLDIMG